MQRFLDKFSLYDLIVIAMMSALGIATKPIIVPLAQIITGPLFIPSGAVAGGFYMLWLVLGFGITGKRGTMTLIGLVQAILVMATGIVGSHGVLSLVTYTMPGILADLGLLLIGHRVCCFPCAFLAGLLCNIAGTIMVNFVYFRLPVAPLVLSLSAAALSGGLGGLVAFKILQQLWKFQRRDWKTSKDDIA
ncbi:hypothetical protein Psch_00584 [Pelotomaculum schinkii]|uniref:ABC-type cobalt transport system, permease component n=1 Tax=Pelotomaculum schinkii TaxID=78350 RepID=A0A4Y7RE44_9FIRM|nr:ECF transporter S component [Pelotomaculum schinkii]TEB07043.1 hypothetical protein Psch_00584 [Pelotomaculum schinkii]